MSSSAKNKKLIIGKKPVKVLCEKRPDLVKKIIISKSNQHLKKELGIHFNYDYWTADQFNKNFPNESHQRCIAIIKKFKFTEWHDFINEIKSESKLDNLILILDRIQDPTNFGLLIRAAVAAGIRYLIIPNKEQASVNATVAKTSVGSLFSIKIIESLDLLKTINLLKKLNFIILTSDVSGGQAYNSLNIKNKNIALIIGNENEGVDIKIKKIADKKINIPTKIVNSLNVAMAATVMIFDIRRQQKYWEK